MHSDQTVSTAGADVRQAAGIMVMLHGRGADANDMLGLAGVLGVRGFTYLAPNAEGHAWYPNSFMAPRANNEPWLSDALATVGDIVQRAELESKLSASKIMLLGFSQGACLASEFVLRNPRRYGGLMALSGGLIGAPGTKWDDVTASFDAMPAFFGCSDVDPHIPKERVIESDAVFTRLGAAVTRKLYPGMPHTINDDEIREVQRVMNLVLAG